MADLLDSMTAPPDLWSLLRKDPFAPDNPTAQSQQYPGVSNQAVYNAQRNSLGNVGALLLSSAQRQSPDQRAQTLGQLGNAANIQPGLNEQQQIMLRNVAASHQAAQTAVLQRTLQQEKMRDQAVRSPEFRDAFNSTFGINLNPTLIQGLGTDFVDKAITALLSRDPASIAALKAQVEASNAAAAASRAQTALHEYDLGLKKAFGGGDIGAPGIGAPVTPGSAVTPPVASPAGISSGPTAATMPGVAPTPSSPQTAPSQPSTFGPNPSEVFGSVAPFQEVYRSGQGLLSIPFSSGGMQNEKVTASIEQLNRDLIGALKVNIDGKPSTWAMKLTEGGLPDPNTFTTGPQRAVAKYQAVQEELGRQYQIAQQTYRFAGAFGDKEKMLSARQRMDELQTLGTRVNSLTSGLQSNISGQLPPDHPYVQEMRKRNLPL